jgi:hypothetical protein
MAKGIGRITAPNNTHQRFQLSPAGVMPGTDHPAMLHYIHHELTGDE